MKIYNVDFDTATPELKRIKVPSNTSKYGLGVAVKENGKDIYGLSTYVLDGGATVSPSDEVYDYNVFALSSGRYEQDRQISVSAVATPNSLSSAFISKSYSGGGQKRIFKIGVGELNPQNITGFDALIDGTTKDLISYSVPIYQSFVNAFEKQDDSYSKESLYFSRFSSCFFLELSGDVQLSNIFIAVNNGKIEILDLNTAGYTKPTNLDGYSDFYWFTFGSIKHIWAKTIDKLTITTPISAAVCIGEGLTPIALSDQTDVTLTFGKPVSQQFSLILDETPQVFADGEIQDKDINCETISINGVNYAPTTLSVDGVAYSVLAAMPN